MHKVVLQQRLLGRFQQACCGGLGIVQHIESTVKASTSQLSLSYSLKVDGRGQALARHRASRAGAKGLSRVMNILSAIYEQSLHGPKRIEGMTDQQHAQQRTFDQATDALSFHIHDLDDRRIANTMKRHNAVPTRAISIFLGVLN